MPFTKRITIERNRNGDDLQCAGNISGETEDGRRWIMFLDADGAPEVFWPSRDDSGSVQGAPVPLVRQQTSWAREGGRLEVLAESVMNPVGGEKIVSTFPVFTPDEWDHSSTDYTGLQRGVVFCVAQEGENNAEAIRRFVTELKEFWDAEERG